MRPYAILKYLGFALLLNALFLFISASISWYFNENSFIPLFYTALMCVLLGAFPVLFVEPIEEINFKEGTAISVLGWLTTCFFGAVPYFMWGGEFTFAHAVFESVSGYTTTGSTVLQNIEMLTKGLLFWRSSTHFIGGVGIILFVLIILPDSKGVQSSIYRTEVSGISRMTFKTRSKHAIGIILIVYLTLVVVLTLLLWLQQMSFFDAICHSFSTIATGGFSTKNNSIAYFNSLGIEITLTIFMFLSSLHFGLLFMTIKREKKNIFNSPIVKAFALTLLAGIVLVALNLWRTGHYTLSESFRVSSFQIVSLASTTGSVTVDTDSWPQFSKLILYYFMIQCAMVGSTGGGIKFDRIYLFFVSLKRQIRLIIHPQAIYVSRINGNIVSESFELQTVSFIVIYLIILFIVSLLLSAMGIDMETAVSASVTTIGNVGPGFSKISSMGNFAQLPDAAKYLLSLNMLIGRLEIWSVFTLFIILSSKKR